MKATGWIVGQEVKVNGLTLIARKRLEGLNEWLMTSTDGTSIWLLTRYNGCRKITQKEAKNYIDVDQDVLAHRHELKMAQIATAEASRQSIDALFGGAA